VREYNNSEQNVFVCENLFLFVGEREREEEEEEEKKRETLLTHFIINVVLQL
jgi:hypothetical protein